MAKPSEETKAYADGYAAAVADILAFLRKHRSGPLVSLVGRMIIEGLEQCITSGDHVGSGNEDGK